MATLGSVLQSLLLIFIVSRYAESLRPGGRNVRTRQVPYYTSIGYTYYTSVRKQTCTRTCSWSCCYCRRCKSYYRSEPRSGKRTVKRYKAEYYCASGWRPNGDECTTPICTAGCFNGGTCVRPEQCDCIPGWQGSNCRTDTNECATNNGGCQHRCNNTVGSYNCSCDAGYSLDGKHSCRDIDECLGANNCQQRCVNKPGNYSCDCHSGYLLNNDKRTCSDIDECVPRNSTQPVCQHKCNNTIGSFLCTCRKGYLLTSNGKDCSDHDECATGKHTCQQRCLNFPGDYQCACHNGFSLNYDNRSCSDIDECKERTAGCAYQCNNTIGSFQCLCPTGYSLNSDNRTCFDRDECKTGEHRCSQICGNTPGSYYCVCRPGYYLDGDLRTCKGFPCLTISRPVKGFMNCTGLAMDSVCQFSCQAGFTLAGSQVRTCLANGHWSGLQASCKVNKCNKPKPPADGYIKLPCSTVYQGKCSLACNTGYFLNGSQAITCAADSTWQPSRVSCQAMKVCHPNPCQHGGVCQPLNSTAFRCNCSNTAYTGRKCHRGFVGTPKYPRLQVGSNLTITFELSPPEHDLTLKPNSVGLVFQPRSLIMSPSQGEKGKVYVANMTVSALIAGIHLITYTLSGVGEQTYEPVLPDVVSVADKGTSCNGPFDLSLPVGCHDMVLYKCPTGDNVVSVKSTELWTRRGNTAATDGVVTVVSENLTLPLAIRGVTLENTNPLSVQNSRVQCTSDLSVGVQCLPTETLAAAFLQSLTASFPRWFRLTPSKSFSAFQANDVVTYIWTGKDLGAVLKGLGLTVNEESYYSVLLYSNSLIVEVDNSSVKLSRSDKNTYLLVAVDLCSQSTPASVLIAFNPYSYEELNSLPIYQELKLRGWDITTLALQFSSSLRYSVYTSYEHKTEVFGNLELYGTLQKIINGSQSLPIRSLGVNLVGNVILQIPDTKEVLIYDRDTWNAGLKGDVTIRLSLVLLKQEFLLSIPLEQASGRVQYQALQRNTCKINDSYSLLLNGYLFKNPFLTTPVGWLMENGNSAMSFFAYTHADVNTSSRTDSAPTSAFHVGFQLRGTARFGPLLFPNMSISTDIYSEDYEGCNGGYRVPGLQLSAIFNGAEALGRFFTSSDADPLQIFAPSNSDNTTTGMFNTTVRLLANAFQAQVTLMNNSLAFQSDLHFSQKFPASINVSSKLEPWNTLLLQVTGAFYKSKTHIGLTDTLEGSISNYIKAIAETTFSRLDILRAIGAKVNGKIDRSKSKLIQAENLTRTAVLHYLTALKDERAAQVELTKAKRRAANGSLELNKIKASLESLCSVVECPYVCVSGTSCNTCYKDFFSKEQGLCPGICHNVKKERLPPFQEMATCVTEECDKPGGFESLVSTMSCTFESVGKAVVKTAVIYGVTAGLTSLGVPPVISYGIGTALVSYAENKNPEEALKSGVIGGGAMALGGEYELLKPTKEGSVGFTAAKDTAQGCSGDGEWTCELKDYPCNAPVFNYKFTNIPYSCQISCEVNAIKETIASPCCSEVNCASRIRDMKCREKNAFCRIVRKKALSKLNQAQQNMVKPLQELQQARTKHQVAEMVLEKRKMELDAASNNRDILRRAHQAIERAANISKQANERNRALIKDAISLAQLWNTSNNASLVEVKEASFDVALSSPSETQIPVLFRVASKTKDTTIFPIINFAELGDSLEQTAQQIVKELFGKVNIVLRSAHPINQFASHPVNDRKRRALDERETNVSRLVEFKKKCSRITNYRRALTDLIGSLHNSSTESLRLLNTIKNTVQSSRTQSTNFTVNATEAASLRLSSKDVDDARDEVASDEETVDAHLLLELRNSTNIDKVQTAVNTVFDDWEDSMERVFNFTSMECNGFVDCFMDLVDNLYYLYKGLSLPEALQFQRKVAILRKEVKSLVSSEELSVVEAEMKSGAILKILHDMSNETIFCASAPNITVHPAAMEDKKIGQTLELSCLAFSDPAPSYRWRKNGVLLEGSNKNIFTIDKVTTSDSGNYTCEAYNHITAEESTPTHVSVHAPPILTYQPPSDLAIAVNTRFYLLCNATSVAKPLRYQWLYKPIDGDGYSVVPNATFPVLTFGSATKNKEGFYKCNVSNPFDYTLSRNVRVRVLDFSLAVPSLGLTFEIVGDTRRLSNLYKEQNHIPGGQLPKVALDTNENFRHDLESSFIGVFNSLVSAPSNAVQALTVEDCQIINEDANTTCKVSFRLESFNMTGPETLNRTDEENALSVMESVNHLENFTAILVNESVTKGLGLVVGHIALTVESNSWSAGEYISICPIGQVLYENNFLCINCPPGTNGALNGTSPACFPCPVGTFQPLQGQTSCESCPVGFSSRDTGLENLSSCKVPKPEATTTKPTKSAPTESPKPSTLFPTAKTEHQVPSKTTGEQKPLGFESDNDNDDHDPTVQWKIAFAVCAAIIVIGLTGGLVYAINYRVKRIRRYKSRDHEKIKRKDAIQGETFHNPVYEASGSVDQNTEKGCHNPAYDTDASPDIKTSDL